MNVSLMLKKLRILNTEFFIIKLILLTLRYVFIQQDVEAA